MAKPERVSKFLTRCGVSARRKAEELIRAGRVQVNGKTIADPGHQADLDGAIVTVDNVPVVERTQHTYVALYKPRGYISDLKDDVGRPLARDLLPGETRLFPIGRLDYDSEGLILFTTDGNFGNWISHPRYGVEKEYVVKVRGVLTPAEIEKVKKGIHIDEQIYRVKEIAFLSKALNNTHYRVVVTEGRNRMIRRLAERLGHPVMRLKRVRIDKILLGDMKPGEYRELSKREIEAIKKRHSQ